MLLVNLIVLCCDLKLASGCVGSGTLGQGSHTSQIQLLLVTSLGLAGRSYKMIYCQYVPVLGKDSCRRGHAVN